MRIREVVAEDRNDLLGILEATGVFRDYEINVADEVIQDSVKTPSSYRSCCFINETDRAIGYVCWGPVPCTSGTFDLYWIAVHPDFQGYGIGKQLLQHAEADARKQGGRLMLIETSSVSEYEGTRSFYLRNGYNLLATIPDFYRQGDNKIVYGKNFI